MLLHSRVVVGPVGWAWAFFSALDSLYSIEEERKQQPPACSLAWKELAC